MKQASLALMLLAGATTTALAQGNAPFVPVNPQDTSPASALDSMPSKTISNGLVSAKVYLPVPFGFYRSTRFDHAGMITHITYKGQDFGRYWFVKTSPDVKNFTYDKDGLVAHPSDVAAGPVEEFAENGFDAAGPGGRFLKIGVENGEFVRERCDFLVLFQDQLFVLLILGFGYFCSVDSRVSFGTKRCEFLQQDKSTRTPAKMIYTYFFDFLHDMC